MSLYERQAVQALQALQRQPNAAQYFQQLMLQQQISSAQLHNLAAVQQVNLSTTSAGGTITSPRPHGPATSATTTALNQSVLLGGNSAGQGQMYLRSAGSTMAVKTGNQAPVSVTPAASVAPSSTSSPALPLSQLLLSSSAAPVILVPTSNVPTTTQGYSIGPVTTKANISAQTLVVQPLQQAGAAADKGPVPIQPKTAQGHRLPAQIPPRHPTPILPAPPSSTQAAAGGHNAPHIPVQLVGARQGLAAQAVALAQARGGAGQDSTTSANVSAVATNNAMVRVTGSVAPM
ncbi:unnamed protein product [Tetraodon nigroviridis]|uniref:(spotted green pufferfish) hypothetical protein n=1 Tax=Tetraodon nigroviridis TaxID=99883 RepID=Q4SNC2_TETNG|nr:unnamed protein product [Tetraodon nigroviridis]